MLRISFPAACFRITRDGGSSESKVLHTHLHALEKEEVHLPEFVGKGGTITTLDRDLLVLTQQGKIVVIGPGAKEGVYVDGRVPMGNSEWETFTDRGSPDIVGDIRVVGILLTEIKQGNFICSSYTTIPLESAFGSDCHLRS